MLFAEVDEEGGVTLEFGKEAWVRVEAEFADQNRIICRVCF
jgi:hypothetical protein